MSGEPKEVDEALWISDWRRDWGVAPQFRRIISVSPWAGYRPLPGQILIACEIPEGEVPASLVLELAGHANRWRDDFPVLIHCKDGERASLVAACAMIARGRSAGEAIALIRERFDPNALRTPRFAEWIRGLK